MVDFKKRFEAWLNQPNLESELVQELTAIQDNHKEMEERFYKDLEFGTGGLRGIIGAGTNRMNLYTVRKATLGLANYIVSQGTQAMEKGVAIAFDSRKYSNEFAMEAAKVLASKKSKRFYTENSDLHPYYPLQFENFMLLQVL